MHWPSMGTAATLGREFTMCIALSCLGMGTNSSSWLDQKHILSALVSSYLQRKFLSWRKTDLTRPFSHIMHEGHPGLVIHLLEQSCPVQEWLIGQEWLMNLQSLCLVTLPSRNHFYLCSVDFMAEKIQSFLNSNILKGRTDRIWVK